jgi:anti-anti-sigma factor
MLKRSHFSLTFSRAFGKVVVQVRGVVDASAAPALRDRLADIIDGQGNRQVVLDLRETTSIDVAGLAVVVDALMRMREYDGELVLSGPTSGVAEQLRAAGLAEVLVITPDWTHPARGRGGQPTNGSPPGPV